MKMILNAHAYGSRNNQFISIDDDDDDQHHLIVINEKKNQMMREKNRYIK